MNFATESPAPGVCRSRRVTFRARRTYHGREWALDRDVPDVRSGDSATVRMPIQPARE